MLADTCMVPDRMTTLIHNCRDDYNWMDDDTKDYSAGWKPLNQTNMTEQCIQQQDKYDIWKYRNSIELMGSPYVGAVNTYKVGVRVYFATNRLKVKAKSSFIVKS